MKRPGIRIIGLTGGIASGKSSVARFFQQHGVPVIDADQLARIAVLPGAQLLGKITALFGSDVIAADGRLDRKKLGGIVFADAEKRSQLENLLHPEIRRLAEIVITRAAADGHRLLVYMAPLLIEAGAADRVDEIWVVTVTPEIQMERLMRRDGISSEAAQRIISSQMPLAEKQKYGRVVIDNSGTPQQTQCILEEIWKRETGSNNE